jgi:hypothetical protein
LAERPAIAFSADELNPSRVDEPFLPQAAAFCEAGFRAWVLSPGTQRIVTRGDEVAGATVVFRGWMMKPSEYEAFERLVTAGGGRLFVSSDQYRANHHIDGWVKELSDLTPETVLLPPDADLAKELQALAWDRFFLRTSSSR